MADAQSPASGKGTDLALLAMAVAPGAAPVPNSLLLLVPQQLTVPAGAEKSAHAARTACTRVRLPRGEVGHPGELLANTEQHCTWRIGRSGSSSTELANVVPAPTEHAPIGNERACMGSACRNRRRPTDRRYKEGTRAKCRRDAPQLAVFVCAPAVDLAAPRRSARVGRARRQYGEVARSREPTVASINGSVARVGERAAVGSQRRSDAATFLVLGACRLSDGRPDTAICVLRRFFNEIVVRGENAGDRSVLQLPADGGRQAEARALRVGPQSLSIQSGTMLRPRASTIPGRDFPAGAPVTRPLLRTPAKASMVHASSGTTWRAFLKAAGTSKQVPFPSPSLPPKTSPGAAVGSDSVEIDPADAGCGASPTPFPNCLSARSRTVAIFVQVPAWQVSSSAQAEVTSGVPSGVASGRVWP
ncbi:hypothetical protein OUZ56_032440 [Daphnia magna]|uniref:Uncharacterized protein n=1 Tax=Daphnia magna TaxID=35525 RepID=A0ABR0B8Y9_9CRUS|nr:hypothetical protein OUZ56_032440 [Daphnia magna]